MPSPSDITEGLTYLANNWIAVAIVWHVFIATLLVALLSGWQPARRALGLVLTLPLLSVSIVSGLAGNLFNAMFFAAGAIGLATIAARLSTTPVERSSTLLASIGLAMIAFGLLYPHFLGDGAAWRYLYAAPTGVVPCPTLAAAVGFTLWADGLHSRSWTAVLAVMGVFYGLLGIFWLGVHLDLGLLIGSVALATIAARHRISSFRPGWAGTSGS